jgi:hypothetical protein
MALSPADFYAYSRATGAEIPEDPQERAAMAPEVLEFRRNQLKAPQQESNPLQVLGTSALAVGATIGAGLAARRFLGRGQQIPKGPAKSATAGITQADLGVLQKAAGRMPAVEEEFVAYRPDPKEMVSRSVAEARRQTATEDLLRAAQARSEAYQPELPGVKGTLMALRSPSFASAAETGELLALAESRPLSAAPKQLDLLKPASETVAPSRPAPGTTENALQIDPTDRLLEELGQMQAARKKELTSRMSQAYGQRLQKTADELIEQLRSETVDLTTLQNATENLQRAQFANAVESGEDQMTGRMKTQLQRNEDLDMSQIEMLEDMASQNQRSMMEGADPSQMIGYESDAAINQVASQLSDGLPFDQSEGTRSLSSQELADIAKEEMMTLRQNLADRGLRPGTERFERALAQTWTNKSIPGAIPGTQQFRALQEQGKIDVSMPAAVRKAVDVVSAGAGPMGMLPERTVINIGPEAKITSTAAGTAIRGASPSYYTVPPVERTRLTFGTPDPLVIDTPDEVIPDYPSSYTALHQILANPQPPERIDPYAQKYLKGGEAGIGVYGVEPRYVPGAVSKETGEYSKAATERQPTYVPAWLQKKELPPLKTGFERLPTASIESLIAGEGKAPLSKTRMQMAQDIVAERNRAKENLALSEVLRRARIEGRDPQDFLRNFGRNI